MQLTDNILFSRGQKQKTVMVDKKMSLENCEKPSAIIIGGGLVGAACVCILAKRGYQVTMYEKREDIRKATVKKGRSINLALSHRGRKTLRTIDLEQEILKHAVSMKGRFLHGVRGEGRSVLYDPVENQCIYSISRNFLNESLLNAAEKQENVNLHFNHKLINVDFEQKLVTFQNTKTNEFLTSTAQLIIGADGAFSSLRSFMQTTPHFDMSQSYIDHGYLELRVPKKRGDQLVGNHLHIWPRGEFMMIALPNEDLSWTVTLFMPMVNFAALNTEKKLLSFFKTYFSDSIPLIGENELISTYFSNKASALVSIKCSKYQVNDRFLIIGDAAHAMVPFYGQGMNAGFEDCSILNHILEKTKDNIKETVELFSQLRKKDAHAICDLAMYNYIEMRDLVTKPSFKLRRFLDTQLEKFFPDIWIPLYNSISFSHIPYSECVKNRHWQNKILKYTFFITVVIGLVIFLLLRRFY